MNLAGLQIGVTGATGMVGRYLMRELALRGAQPIGVVRSPNKAPSLPALGYATRVADLSDKDALTKAFTGLDAVISNASTIAIGGQSPQKVLANNLGGTANVFEAMAAAGVKRAVMTSSATGYRGGAPRPVIESTPLRSTNDFTHRFNCYAISKAAAETAAQEISAKHGIALSIARPHQIYGAFDTSGFTSYLRLLMAPRFVSLWMTHWYFPSVYAGDLADAMCRMLENDATEAFNVCGEPGLDSYWDHVEAWRAAGLRTPKLIVPIPLPLRRAYSIEKAKRVLGWSPRPLMEGFADLVRFGSEVQAALSTPALQASSQLQAS